MSEKVDRVLQAALALSNEERADFLDAFQIAVCEREELPFDEAWMAEIDRRSDQLARGEVQSIPGDEVEARIRKRLAGGG